MELVSFRTPDNAFEQRVLSSLATARLPGIVTNNVLLPHLNFRNLPNEHDLLVLLEGRIVTLDAKDLHRGAYREAQGGWEFQPPEGKWDSISFMGHPLEIAFKKAKALESYVQRLCAARAGVAMPQVISCIVVPDHCEISGLHFRPDGRMKTGARLLLCRLGDVVEILAGDVLNERQRRPTVEELAELLAIRTAVRGNSTACMLASDLQIRERLSRRQMPISCETFRGEDLRFRRAVRIDVCPLYSGNESADAVMRAYRNNALALQGLRHEVILRLYRHYVTPLSIVMIYELFSDTTLADLLVEQRLTWNEVVAIFDPVTDALRQAHRTGIAHRYLDPGCILVSEGQPRHVRLSGFFGALVQGYSTVGAGDWEDPYRAPESADGNAEPAMLDAFGVGRCIAASMVGDPTAAIPDALVPPGANRILLQLVAREPSARRDAWQGLSHLLGQGAL